MSIFDKYSQYKSTVTSFSNEIANISSQFIASKAPGADKSMYLPSNDSYATDKLNQLRTYTTNEVENNYDNLIETLKLQADNSTLSPISASNLQEIYTGLPGNKTYMNALNNNGSNNSIIIDSVDSIVDKNNSGGASLNNDIKSSYDLEFIRGIRNRDPINATRNINADFLTYLEASGYILNKFRSIQFSRNYHFIQRPALEIDSGGGLYRSYVFWTRPDCNMVIIDSNGRYALHPQMVRFPELASLISENLPLYAELCRSNCSMSNLFPLLSNYTKEIPPPRLSQSDREGPKNMFGFQTPMPGTPIYNDVDITVNLFDNSRGDIHKLFYALNLYRYCTAKDEYAMRPGYIKYKGYDYNMSCYIVVVDPNWEIVSFGTALSMSIGDIPTTFNQHRLEGFSKNELLEEISLSFKAATYKPHNPLYYDFFNNLSKFNPSNIVDTKGSGMILQVPDRANDSVTTKAVMRRTVLTPKSTDDGIKKNVDNHPTTTISPGAVMVAKVPYRGYFEMIAKNPGIYSGINPREPNRNVFKLGFSY